MEDWAEIRPIVMERCGIAIGESSILRVCSHVASKLSTDGVMGEALTVVCMVPRPLTQKLARGIASSMVSNTLDEVVEREGVGEQAPVEHVAGWPEASDTRQAMGRIATATVAMR